jgi:hypothetical protein
VAEWVGIGGVGSSTQLIQAGVSETPDSNAPGGLLVFPWWEVYPTESTSIVINSVVVSAGDEVSIAISQVSGSEWAIALTDDTNQQSFTTDQTVSGIASTAESIMEAPANYLTYNQVVALAPFRPDITGTVGGAVEVSASFFDPIRNGHFGVGITQLEQRGQARGGPFIEKLLAAQEHPAGPLGDSRAGMVEVKAPRVDDRRQGERYSSASLPAYMRTSPKVTDVLPNLYLLGLSTGEFAPALAEFFRSDAGLSASTVNRLTVAWQAEHGLIAGTPDSLSMDTSICTSLRLVAIQSDCLLFRMASTKTQGGTRYFLLMVLPIWASVARAVAGVSLRWRRPDAASADTRECRDLRFSGDALAAQGGSSHCPTEMSVLLQPAPWIGDERQFEPREPTGVDRMSPRVR